MDINLERRAYLDYDNVLKESDMALQRAYLDELHERYPDMCLDPDQPVSLHFEPLTPGGKLPDQFHAVRTRFLRDPMEVAETPFLEGVPLGVMIMGPHFEGVVLNTARLEELKEPIKDDFRESGILPYFSGMFFRSDPLTPPQESKISNAQLARITDGVDDDPKITVRLSQLGIRMGLIDQIWNRDVPSGRLIIRFGGLIDYAVAIYQFGTPEALFDYHFNDILKGQDSIQPPWRVTPKEIVDAIEGVGRIRKMRKENDAQEANTRLAIETITGNLGVLKG